MHNSVSSYIIAVGVDLVYLVFCVHFFKIAKFQYGIAKSPAMKVQYDFWKMWIIQAILTLVGDFINNKFLNSFLNFFACLIVLIFIFINLWEYFAKIIKKDD